MASNPFLQGSNSRRASAHFSPAVGLAVGTYTSGQPQDGEAAPEIKRGKIIKNLTIMQEILDKERDRIDGRVSTAGITKYELVRDNDIELGQKKIFDPLAEDEQFSGLMMSVYKHDSLATSYLNQTMFSALYPRDNKSALADNSLVGNAIFPMAGGLTFNRANYAAGYGLGASPQAIKDTYIRNVDLLHESPTRYQELSHWRSSQEKPTEANLTVLQKQNHTRLATLQQLRDTLHKEPASAAGSGLPRRKDQAQRTLRSSSHHRTDQSAERRLKMKNDHLEQFSGYLERKGGAKEADGSRFILDFDLYECTSPNPKRRTKDFYRVLPDER
jgi:hypothetical protein